MISSNKKNLLQNIYKILLLLHSLYKCYVFISYFQGRKKFTGIIVKKKVRSFIAFMFNDYVMFLFRNKDVAQAIFSFFGLVTATSFDFLR